MTVQYCGALAQSQGYSLFGLQYYKGEIAGTYDFVMMDPELESHDFN